MSAVPAPRQQAGCHADTEWAELEIAAPRVAATMLRYLRQLSTFLAPRSVDAADGALLPVWLPRSWKCRSTLPAWTSTEPMSDGR